MGLALPPHTPQAALDVVGSILCSAGLRAGNIDVIERLLEHTASLQTIASQLLTKQPVVVDDALEIRQVKFLKDSLDAKQNLLSDLSGTGVSLLHGTKLRKIYGDAGIAVEHTVNLSDFADPTNFQVRVSGAELQSSI